MSTPSGRRAMRLRPRGGRHPTRVALVALLALLGVLPACYSPPPEIKLALTVTGDGQITLDGRSLSLDDLRQVLAARVGPKNSTLLEIHASPAVAMPAIERVVAVAKQTGIAVAFATAGSAP